MIKEEKLLKSPVVLLAIDVFHVKKMRKSCHFIITHVVA